MKLKDFINKYTNILLDKNFESANIDVEVLFCFVSGFSRVDIISKSELEVQENVEKKFIKLFIRRLNHEPIAYILGYKNFCGFDFKVNKNVLIPRPLTESLVGMIYDYVDNKHLSCKDNSKFNLIEIGTGSGCVIISLVKKIISFYNNSLFNFFASDLSLGSLCVAKSNAKYFCVFDKIKFLIGDLKFKNNIKYDVIIANLPYVDFDSIDFNKDEHKDLNFEPKLALYHKDKGFYLIRKLLNKVLNKNLLGYNGVIFMEIEKGQSYRIRQEFNNFFNVEEFFDGRIVKIYKKN